MKKFNPEEEYNNLQLKSNRNGSTINNFFVPVLIVGCSCLALLGVTFSTKLIEVSIPTYDVKVDVINGDIEHYERTVNEGGFRDVITSGNSFGSISCTEGNLHYDSETSTISSVYINKNTSCVLVFMDDGLKNINVKELTQINDNSGVAYLYRADSKNNYIKINNMMYRIIRVNGDGTLRVMLDDAILASKYGNENYNNSYVKKTLEDFYNRHLAGLDYVVDSDFDASNYENNYDISHLLDFDVLYYKKVGLLSVREAVLMSEDVKTNNFLNTGDGMYLMNPSGNSFAYIYKNSKVEVVNYNTNLIIKPVINIKVDKLLGNGTFKKPYTISK